MWRRPRRRRQRRLRRRRRWRRRRRYCIGEGGPPSLASLGCLGIPRWLTPCLKLRAPAGRHAPPRKAQQRHEYRRKTSDVAPRPLSQHHPDRCTVLAMRQRVAPRVHAFAPCLATQQLATRALLQPSLLKYVFGPLRNVGPLPKYGQRGSHEYTRRLSRPGSP